jgi:hypothetical protein
LSSGLPVSACKMLVDISACGSSSRGVRQLKAETWKYQGYLYLALASQKVTIHPSTSNGESDSEGCDLVVILTLRTWIIWEKKRGVAMVLIPFFIASWIGVGILVRLALQQLDSKPTFIPHSRMANTDIIPFQADSPLRENALWAHWRGLFLLHMEHSPSLTSVGNFAVSCVSEEASGDQTYPLSQDFWWLS